MNRECYSVSVGSAFSQGLDISDGLDGTILFQRYFLNYAFFLIQNSLIIAI